MVVCHGVEELLCIQCTSKKKSKISVGGLDDVGNLVYSLPPVEGILVSETVFDPIRQLQSVFEGLGNSRQKSGVYDGCSPWAMCCRRIA